MIRDLYFLGFEKASEEFSSEKPSLMEVMPDAQISHEQKKALATGLAGALVGAGVTGAMEGRHAITPGNLKATTAKIIAAGAAPFLGAKILERVEKDDAGVKTADEVPVSPAVNTLAESVMKSIQTQDKANSLSSWIKEMVHSGRDVETSSSPIRGTTVMGVRG